MLRCYALIVITLMALTPVGCANRPPHPWKVGQRRIWNGVYMDTRGPAEGSRPLLVNLRLPAALVSTSAYQSPQLALKLVPVQSPHNYAIHSNNTVAEYRHSKMRTEAFTKAKPENASLTFTKRMQRNNSIYLGNRACLADQSKFDTFHFSLPITRSSEDTGTSCKQTSVVRREAIGPPSAGEIWG